MRTQDVDVVSLLAGVMFAGLGLWFTVAALGLGRLNLGIVWPILLVAAGAAVLLAARSRGRPKGSDPFGDGGLESSPWVK